MLAEESGLEKSAIKGDLVLMPHSDGEYSLCNNSYPVFTYKEEHELAEILNSLSV